MRSSIILWVAGEQMTKIFFFQRYTAKEEEGIDTVCSKGTYSKSKGRNNPLHKDGQSKGKSPSVQ